MSISVNGQSVVPPGFRFHPTEEELLTYYLKKKVASEPIDLDVIRDVDLNKLEPWDIQERCKIGSGPQNDWYFFSHKDKKYPTGTRTNRATAAGFWKATGRDKAIYGVSSGGGRRIGMRKTLVFYKGRAPHGHKSDWIMHEYRLDDPASAAVDNAGDHLYPSPPPHAIRGAAGDQSAAAEEGWVICRVFKKKHLVHHGQSSSAGQQQHAAASSKMAAAADPMESSPTSNCSSVTAVGDHHHHAAAGKAAHSSVLHYSASDDALDHILQYMGRQPQQQQQQDTKPGAALLDHHHHLTTPPTSGGGMYGRFMKLPPLEHVAAGGGLLPSSSPPPAEYASSDWDALDYRLAASYELNSAVDASSKNNNMCGFVFDDPTGGAAAACFSSAASGDGDLWSLARSVSSSLHADLTMNNV